MTTEKMVYNNTFFETLQEFLKDKGVWSTEDLRKAGLLDVAKQHNEEIGRFDSKKVKVSYISQFDWSTMTKTAIGTIRKLEDNSIMFFPGRNTRNGYYIDSGVFKGFRSTIVPIKIESI